MGGPAAWTRRGAAGAIAAALAGCATGGDAARASREITVATLNIWHDQGNWPARLPLIVAALRALSPDVVALQEVLQDAATGLPNQAETIAGALGMTVRFASVDAPDAPRRYGNAILSRGPARGWDQIRLEPLDDYRTALRVRTETRAGPLDVFCTHLHHTDGGAAIRSRQVEALTGFIGRMRSPGIPVLLMGDFNARPDAPELTPLTARFSDIFAAAHPGDRSIRTFRAGPPGQRIDQIWAQTGAFATLSADLFLDRPTGGVFGSDHLGVAARLRLKP